MINAHLMYISLKLELFVHEQNHMDTVNRHKLGVANKMHYQWHQEAGPNHLKHTCTYNASATIYGDHIYILVGNCTTFDGLTSVFTCSLSTLLQSCSMDFPDGIIVWSKIPDLEQVTNSNCVSLSSHLLASRGIERVTTHHAQCTTQSSTHGICCCDFSELGFPVPSSFARNSACATDWGGEVIHTNNVQDL